MSEGTSLGFVPQWWMYSRVGNGKVTLGSSPDLLWERVEKIIRDAESDFEDTFEALFEGALAEDGGLIPLGEEEFIPWYAYLERHAATVANSVQQTWAFTSRPLFSIYQGLEALRTYKGADGRSVRISLTFFQADTPPLLPVFLDNVTPGKYQIYYGLKYFPNTDEVLIPVRTFKADEIVDLWDTLIEEFEVLRENYTSTFQSSVDPKDEALFSSFQNVLDRPECSPPIFPRMDKTDPRFLFIVQSFQCA